MYEAFYKLANDPFRLLPDPDICFPHRSCAKAWAYLRYALKRGEGIVVITGPPGSGKTTLAGRLLNELNPSKTVSVKLIANDLNPTDLLRKLAYSFGLPAEGMDRAMLAHRIERYLIELEHGNRQALVLIDEAQTLSHQSLEAMRLLTDLQSRSRPVLQLFLLGQEDLEGVMCAPGMTQFQQRVIASCRLHRMDLAETKAYLEYRLSFADWTGDPSINGPAVMAIFRSSRGLPRHINKICSRLLLHGCTEEKHALKQRDVMEVVQDLRDELLTPMEAETEAESMVEIAGSTVGSVYELALVPAPPKQAPRDAMDTMFLAEEQAPQTDAGAGVAYQPKNDVSRGTPRGHSGGHYSYRVGYPRPYRFRRRVHRLTQFPRMLVARIREWMRKRAPSVGGFLARVGRKATAHIVQLAQAAHRWFRGRTPMPGVLNGRVQSLPNAAIAGLGGLLAVGLAFATWSHDGDSQRALAGGETQESGPKGASFLMSEAVPAGSAVLDETPQYLDVESMPSTQGTANSNPLNVDGTLAQGAVRSQSPDDHSRLIGDTSRELLGRVADSAAGRLVDGAAQTQAASTLDVWSLADEAPDAGRETAMGDSIMEVASVKDPDTAEPEGTGPLPAAGIEGAIKSEGLVTDQNPTDEATTLLVKEESGLSPEYVNSLPPTAAGVSVSEVSAEADTGVVEESMEELVPASATGDDMVTLNVAEASASDQTGIDTLAVRQHEIEEALVLAEQAMKKDRLLQPAKGSAYGYYQRVLEIDARNEDAHAGMRRIVQRYRVLAKWALDKRAFGKADTYLGRGLRVDPDNSPLLALRGELNEAIAEAELEAEAAELEAAELARMALEMAQPKPIAEPKQQPESSLSNLMRYVDGL